MAKATSSGVRRSGGAGGRGGRNPNAPLTAAATDAGPVDPIEAMSEGNRIAERLRRRIQATGNWSNYEFEGKEMVRQREEVRQNLINPRNDSHLRNALPTGEYMPEEGDSLELYNASYDFKNDKVYSSITRGGTFRSDEYQFSVRRNTAGDPVGLTYDGRIDRNTREVVTTPSPYAGKPHKYEPKEGDGEFDPEVDDEYGLY